jgi:2',3'-cyclic-nucleotide 2'-phosphodiesterase (5'-nucleotidase family)
MTPYLSRIATIVTLAVVLPWATSQGQNTTEVGYLFVQQNNSGNTTASVSATPALSSFTNFTSTVTGTDRGDFRVVVGNGNADRDVGAYLVSVGQNGRDNTGFGDTIGPFYAIAAPVISTTAAAPTYISAYRIPNGTEVNINIAAGFFPYQRWLSGFAPTATTLFANPAIVRGTQLVLPGTGVNTLNLQSVDASFTAANGVLLANETANNSTFFANTKANSDGTFTIYTRDNTSGENGAGTAQRGFTFGYFPLSAIGRDGLRALGRVNSDGTTDVSSGNFTVTKGPVGQWFLSIENQSFDTGTLLVSPAGGDQNNTDNVLSYQWDEAAAHWVIESRDIVDATTTVPEDGATADEDMFSFVFFEQRLAPTIALRLEDPAQVLSETSSFKVIADAADADGEVVSVQFLRNGQPVGSVTNPPYELSQSNVDPGVLNYTAVVTDDEGRTTTSAALRVQVYTRALTAEVGTLEVQQFGPGNADTDIAISVRPGTSTPNFQSTGGNRGDFNVAFGTPNDVLAGTVVVSIAENGRDNDAVGGVAVPAAENPWVGRFFATASIADSGASSYFLPVNRTSSGQGSSTVEVNINVGVGFFPYSVWLGGYARNIAGTNGGTNNLLYANPAIRLGQEFAEVGAGVFLLDLQSVGTGYNAGNGIVLANHAKNEGNHATVQANEDGTFTLFVRDNAAAGTGNEQDPISFVYLPLDRIGFQGLTALGRVKGDASLAVQGGTAVVSKGPVGTYYLSIAGESADTGTLLISAAGGQTVNTDNIVNYEWDPENQRWVIESRDLQTAAQAGTTSARPRSPELEDIPAGEDAFNFAFFKASARRPTVELSAAGVTGERAVAPASFNVVAAAADEDGQVASVEFFVNGLSVGVQTSAPYQLPVSNLVPGSYVFTARVRDNDDYTSTSEPLRVEVVFGEVLPTNTALWFDGQDDHVRLPVGAAAVGAPPSAGFTLECWFRREGTQGQAAASGALSLLPLIAKGRQEGENDVSDVNYLFGLTLDGKLGVDFEAITGTGVAGGANFPLVGTHSDILSGRWYHAAVSYDAVAGVMKLYLDGVEVGSRNTVAGARPRFDSNHAASLGTAYNTGGVSAGAFSGVMDEVRIWNYGRSQAELNAAMAVKVSQAGGLVARFGLDEGSGRRTVSSVADNLTGELVNGPVWTNGAPVSGEAPVVVLAQPMVGAVMVADAPVMLAAAAKDNDGTVTLVEFFVNGVKVGDNNQAPYFYNWGGAPAGIVTITAVATDNAGLSTQSEPVMLTLVDRPGLLVTEVQSAQSVGAPVGAADYWELKNTSTGVVDLEGYTWSNLGGDPVAAQAWAFPNGTTLAAGEAMVVTAMDPADFRAWWGLAPTVKVAQCVGCPDLGENDSIRLFNAVSAEVLTFSYAAGGFTTASGGLAVGGHAGVSGGGLETAALVWVASSGVLAPRYGAAVAGEGEAGQAATGDDVGSPGNGVNEIVVVPLALVIDPGTVSEGASNPAATGWLMRLAGQDTAVEVALSSSDTTELTVPATVSLAVGEGMVSFPVTVVDDALPDGSQVVRVSATAVGYAGASQDVVVEDDGDALPPEFLLTEVQSAQSSGAPAGAADYFEITHFGDRRVSLEGFTWGVRGQDFATTQAWAIGAGAFIDPGETVVITSAAPAAFRTWWGLSESVKVFQTPGAPDLGPDGAIKMFTRFGLEVFEFGWGPGEFTTPLGFASSGGHAGSSAGGAEAHLALVWNSASSYAAPTYQVASRFRNGGRAAVTGLDVGSPGAVSGEAVVPPLPAVTNRGPVQFELVSTFPLPGAEIPAYDVASKRLFVTGASGLQVIDLTTPALPEVISLLDFTRAPFGLNSTDVTSVAVRGGVVAVAVANGVKSDPGTVVFLDAATNTLLSMVTVGVLPDMVCFTPDGSKVLTADEGEMLEDGTDPAPGSVSIIDVSGGFAAPTVTTIGFTAFDAVAADLKAAGVRIFEDPLNPGTLKLPSIDLEPEYIAVAPDSTKAMVTLQEANAVAILDLATATFTSIVPLGEKDYSALLADFSDRDGGIQLTTGNPVYGLYLPDAIASYEVNGQVYYITANEGDDRNDFLTETIRLNDASYVLDPAVFPNAAELKGDSRLGRLVVSNSPGLRGDTNNDGLVDRILTYGGRSISILAADGSLVWESGDMIERVLAELGTPWFDDGRSPRKGPEPEGVVIGEIEGRIYAFIALERSRGVMVFDVTDPQAVKQAGFVGLEADLNPESMVFVPAADSPTGKPMLAVTNETSRTVTLYNVSRYTLQMFHLADAEAGLLASETAPMLAALVEGFAGSYANTLTVSGGDNFIPGPFLSAGTDPLLNGVAAVGRTNFGRPDMALHNLLGVEASGIGNHEWDLGTGVFMDAIRPDGAWVGAQFPYLSVNLDYSGDSAAVARFTDVPLNGVVSAVPAAGDLKGRLAPMAVVEKGGERIGLLGVTTQILNTISSPSGTVVKGATANNMDLLAAQLQLYVDELAAEGVNKIILLSHLQQLAFERELATKLRGVDIVVAAGSNTRLGDANDVAVAFPGHAADFADEYPIRTTGADGAPVLVVSTDNEFTYLGRLLVDFDLQGRVVLESLDDYSIEAGAYAATAATVAAVWDVAEADLATTAFAPGTRGAAVRGVTQAVQTVINAKDGTVYGYTDVYLEGERSQVRGQETNLGNLTADANLLALARRMAGVVPIVSFKNGGGIRAQIGAIANTGGGVVKLPPPANPAVGKLVGGVSQLDLENALRFNNRLMSFETTPQGLKALLEHGVAGWPNQGRFPQVGGVAFAWDPDRPEGDRVTSIALVNGDGTAGAPIYKAGPLAAALLNLAPPVIRVVTLNFIANGGDGYPCKGVGQNFRYLLADGTLGPVIADTSLNFTVAPQLPGNAAGEQAALAEYLQARHGSPALAYQRADTDFALDFRIQNLRFRMDMVPPVGGVDSDRDGLSDLDELLLGSNPFAPFRVGDMMELDLSRLLGSGEALRLLGRLPPGVRFDPVTGRLSGLIGGVPALYDLQAVISGAGGAQRVVNLRFGLEAFPARLVAGYEALLETEEGVPVGILRMALNRASSWTASLDLAGAARRSTRGTFALETGVQRATVPMVFRASRTAPEVQLTVRVAADSAQISGQFVNGLVEGNLRGFRLVNFGGSPPDVRRLNAVLDAGEQDGVVYPAGLGWLKGTVSKTGAVNLRGQLGDSQAVTLAARLSVTGQALVWAQPYRNKTESFFGGVMQMPRLGQPTALSPSLVAGAVWFKAADAREKAYAAGFPVPLSVTISSSGFVPTRTAVELEGVLGLAGSRMGVEIQGGGLSSGLGALPKLPAGWNLAANFGLISDTLDAVPWAGRVVKADGGMAGTLTLPAGPANLAGRAAVSGVLLPEGAGGSVIGGGLVRVPVAGARGEFRTASMVITR